MIAAFLGIVAGVVLGFLNRRGAGFMDPRHDAGLGMTVAFGTLASGLLVAIALMFVVWIVARPSVGPFGIALALSFLTSTVIALVPQLRAVPTNAKGR